MPQLQPFFYLQELGSIILILVLITIFINYYVLPNTTITQAIRRFLVSL